MMSETIAVKIDADIIIYVQYEPGALINNHGHGMMVSKELVRGFGNDTIDTTFLTPAQAREIAAALNAAADAVDPQGDALTAVVDIWEQRLQLANDAIADDDSLVYHRGWRDAVSDLLSALRPLAAGKRESEDAS